MAIEENSELLYNKIIDENLDKGFQVRLTVTEFREVIYLQLRKYFLSYEGEWTPSRDGVSIPASIENVRGLLDGLLDVLAQAEGHDIIKEYYGRIQGEQAS